ncbi:MAG: glutaredoxin family protein [Actinobacteria bacterium]|nr:glutaredoxin family protein [Actinomycetota bacterium]
MPDFKSLEQVEGSKQDHDLVLYALSTCGWCKKARTFLGDNDVAYRFVYVDLLEGDELDQVFSEVKRLNPQKTFPTLVIDDEDVIIGFNDSTYTEKLL